MSEHPYRMRSWTLKNVASYLKVRGLDLKPLYLAHSLGTRHFVKDIIEMNLNISNIKTLNPFANRPYLYTIKTDEERKIILANEKNKHTAEMIVLEDLEKIRKCCGLIAYIEKPSFGMAMEIFYTAYDLKLPVWLIFANPEDDLKFHPWLSHLTKGYIQ